METEIGHQGAYSGSPDGGIGAPGQSLGLSTQFAHHLGVLEGGTIFLHFGGTCPGTIGTGYDYLALGRPEDSGCRASSSPMTWN